MSTAEKSENTSLIERLSSAGAHYGYARSRRHPSMRSALFGTKNQTDIIDLEKTCAYLNRAREFVEECARQNKTILFVGTKPEAKAAVQKAAETARQPFMVAKWVGGTLTNFSEIRKRVNRLIELEEQKERGELSVYTRQEQRELQEEMDEIRDVFGGIVHMDRLPDAILIIDPEYEDIAHQEARKLNIPEIALANSDCDISGIAYPVPANDASRPAIELFADTLAEAYKKESEARAEEREKAEAQAANNEEPTEA